MSAFPGSPRLLKGGIVLIDPQTSAVVRIIPLQYNPDGLSRTLHPKAVAGEAGDRSVVLRLTGPPVETIKLDAEIDAADQLESPDQNPDVVQNGIQAQLAALETIIYPASQQIQSNLRLAQAGTLEIVPMETPLTLFVWSKNRVLPVRITDFAVIEEAFDTQLNPIRAKVSLGMRVLTVDDFPPDHKGTSLFMAYHQQKERLAARNQGGALSGLGITSIP
jgi:hypothetical protein